MPSLYEGRSQTFDIVKLVNTTNELLNKNQGSLRHREELQTRWAACYTQYTILVWNYNIFIGHFQ